MRRAWQIPRPLSTAMQYSLLRGRSICAASGTLRHGRLRWDFEVEPTPIARVYLARLSYRLGRPPRVLIVRPDLGKLAKGRRLPHVYRQEPPTLCLYFPKTREWTADMRLVDTVVPWTYLWLLYFEDWLDTGIWRGGGVHPGKQRG